MTDQNDTRKKRLKPNQVKFIAAYLNHGTVSKAAEMVGIERMTHYRWLKKEGDYLDAWNDAHEIWCENLEREAYRRAYEGIDKPIVYQGKVTKSKRMKEYSDTLLIFLMKGNMPDKYKERTEIQAHVKPGQFSWADDEPEGVNG